VRTADKSSWVRILLAATALAGLAFCRGPVLLGLLAVLVALHLLLQPSALLLFTRLRFWLFALAPLLIGTAVFGPRDLSLGFFKVSTQGLLAGLWMCVRTVCLLLIFQLAMGGLSVARLIGLFHSRGLRGLGFALGVAYNMLATLSEISCIVLNTLRLRGALRRHPLLSLRLFVVAVVSAALRHGEDIVHAATARGFDAR
jgi:energy-coupling factor transporter transmembrane protein EcfT